MSFIPEPGVTTRSGETLTVRKLTSADAQALKDFNAALSPASRRFFLPHPYDADTVDKALKRAENGDDLLLGLFAGARLVGYFFLWYYTTPVPLLGIGLVDDYHGQGLGRKLMQILIDAAIENDCAGIELTTMRDNDVAYRLYESMGFEHYRDVRNLQGTGEWVVERAMFYRIKADAEPMTDAHQPPV